MEVEIKHRPGAAAVRVQLAPGEGITSEAGAMIAMSDHITVTTTTHKKQKGSIWKGIKRLFSGESFFVNHFSSPSKPGEIWLGTTLVGDMEVMDLNNETLIVQGGSFVACEEGVDVDLGYQGLKSLFSGEGLFWVHMKGTGKVIINSFGAIYPVHVNGDFIVDSGHIVAFQETLNFTVTKVGGSWISSFLGGEGFVTKFSGQGIVWCQSHNPSAFGRALGSLLPPR